MPFNVLLLPLLGGYIFISHWNITRFTARRYSGERLLIHSALAGLIFLLLAFGISSEVRQCCPMFVSWWRNHIPFAYSGTSLLSFCIGGFVWLPLNAFANREGRAIKTVTESGDFLEILLSRSVRERKQIAISLRSGKVYVGFVITAFDPAFDRRYMMLMPTLSGYRDETTKEMRISNDYGEAYEKLVDEDPEFLNRVADEFQLVIPVTEIVSANLFDPEVYELFSGR